AEEAERRRQRRDLEECEAVALPVEEDGHAPSLEQIARHQSDDRLVAVERDVAAEQVRQPHGDRDRHEEQRERDARQARQRRRTGSAASDTAAMAPAIAACGSGTRSHAPLLAEAESLKPPSRIARPSSPCGSDGATSALLSSQPRPASGYWLWVGVPS